MKNKIMTTTALVSTVFLGSTAAYSDTSNFEGPFISAGASFGETETTFKNNAGNIPATVTGSSTAVEGTFIGFETSATTIIGRALENFTSDDSTVSGELTIGYNYPVNDKFLLGLDASYNSGGSSVTKNNDYTQATIANDANALLSTKITQAAGVQTTKYEEDETISIGLRPSFAINDKTMIYSRLSYGQTKATLSTKYSLAADSTADKSVSDDLESYGIGVGTVYNFNNNSFIDLSVNYRETEKFTNKIDDSGQTASLTSVDLSSATNDLITTADDTETYSITAKVGMRF